MAYRDTRDPRIVQLKELVATEPSLLLERKRLRAQFDRLQAAHDELAVLVAEHEQGGVVAWVSGWFSNAAEERKSLYESQAAELAKLADEERWVESQLADAARARAELDQLELTNLHQMRSAPGPVGTELRELDTEIASEEQRIADLDVVVRAAEQAEAAATSLVALHREVRATEGELEHDKAVESMARAVAERIREVVTMIDRLCASYPKWAADGELAGLRRSLAADDETTLCHGASRTMRVLSSVLSSIGMELRRHVEQRDRLVARQRELVEQNI